MDKNGYNDSLRYSDGCYFCGKTNGKIDRHEVYHGAYRDKSKRLGCWVNLCHECHMRLHQMDVSMDRMLKEEFQPIVMNEYGWDEKRFIREFGKNYV